MCRLTNCCCCVDLRTGTIFISILLFISTLANIAVTTIDPNLKSGASLAFFIIFTIAAIGFWIVLFIGALMRNTTMLGISMIALICYIVLVGILLVLVIIGAGISGGRASSLGIVGGYTYSLAITFLVLYIIGILAEIGLFVYFVLVIQSFRLEIIAGGSGSGLPYPT